MATPVLGQSDPPDVRTATHLLENATFGPTTADIVAIRALGVDRWLEEQFNLPESDMPDGLDTNGVRAQLFLNMANGRDQLRQRVMFALSQFIVVSAAKTGSGPELIPWVRLLSRNAFGNYHTLLTEVSVNPTMGKYLDLAYSKKASTTSSPNENYARELLQLFSIGLWELNQDGSLRRDGQNQPIPTYSQATIKEYARALTGWTFPTQPGVAPATSNPPYFYGIMEPRTTTHDTGAKALLGVTLPAGQSAVSDMQGVLASIFQHPNVPPFVATRLIRSLVTSNPSPGYILRVANAFSNNGQGVRGDLRAVIRAVLLDPEALRFSSPTDGRLKDPVLHITGLGRALNARVSDPNAFMWVFNNLAERVLTPPTVFSFYSPLAPLPGRSDLFGPEFQIYPPALAVQRANFIYSILAGSYSSSFAVDLTPFTAVAANTPALVARVDHALMFGRMSNDLRERLTMATNAIAVSNTRERALGALFLAAISSEYTVSADNDGPGIATLPLSGPGGSSPGSGGTTGTSATTPSSLMGSATGFVLALNWRNPAGGTVSGVVLDVTGSIVASVPLPPTESFTYANVPAGTYTFTVRATGPAGVSAPSNAITLTFPGTGVMVGGGGAMAPCSGMPATPVALAASRSSNVVTLTWQAGQGGDSPSGYVVSVSGSYVGSFQTAAPTLTGAAGPGTYLVSVHAVNACGASAQTPAVTVTIP
ncbi:MAG: DUF1800 family protein [Acidobacteriota bacterium]